ncbi:MAG: hypothetical protein HQL19_04545 [Candidatus Omnitrophica bacterium]|nr:hypothetical protein [Candidatus Omnitrophota bacterium]
MSKHIAHIVVGVPVDGPFDYLIPDELVSKAVIGARVHVLFGGLKRVGIVVGLAGHSSFQKLNRVLAVLDGQPVFTPAFLKFTQELAFRSGCSWGEMLEIALPSYLRTPKTIGEYAGSEDSGQRTAGPGKISLIFDKGLVKRWDVLTPRIRATLAAGRSVVCLAPDGNVLMDILPRLKEAAAGAPGVALMPGTDKQEFERWLKLRSGEARVAAGFISAVFAPVQDPGLMIVIDEEAPAYKHDQSPFYHVREAVLLRAQYEGCDVVFVSNAPSIEAWYLAKEKKAELVVLEEEALPAVKFIDLTNFKMKKETWISPALRNHLEAALKDQRKALLYIQAAKGTMGVVEEVRKYFPAARVCGYDKASTTLAEGWDVLVATQAVFRHQGKWRADIAAVLGIDFEFHKNDHGAAHGAYALVQHLRQMTKGVLFLQTRQMDNTHLHALADQDHRTFYEGELKQRAEMDFPPYGALIAIVLRSADPELACAEAKRLYDILVAGCPEGVVIHEPQQDRAPLVRGKFRHCVMVQSKDIQPAMSWVKAVFKTFRGKKDLITTVNVNP